MKISCNACGSNYAIADEKVAGRLVKVRCKSCGAAIVVDARQQSGAATAGASKPQTVSIPPEPSVPPPQDPSSSGEATWSVNLSETDSRSMTTAEIIAAYHQGLLADAYVWKEGMDDWAPLFNVPELAAAVMPPPDGRGASPVAHGPSFGVSAAAAGAAGLGTGLSFGSPGAARTAATRPKQTPDLFGGVALAGSEEDARRAPAEEPDHHQLVGARNENSVLFSLDALKAGVTGAARSPAGASRPAPNAPSRGAMGPRRAEVSEDPFGMSTALSAPMFDPNANLALLHAPAPPPPKPEPRRPRVEETSVAVAAVPVATTSKGTIVFAIAGTAVVTLGIAGIVLAIVLSRIKDTEVTAVAATSTSAEVAKPESPAPTPSTAETTTATSEPAASVSAIAEGPTAPAEPLKPLTPEEKAAQAKKQEEAAKAREEAKAAAEAARKAEAAKKEEAAVASGFDKGAAVAALSSAASAATSCKRAGGPTGTGKVQVTFAPSGRVTSANVVGGAFGGTSVGSCVASAFRSARVPPFSGSPVTVSKSFTIPP
ncbi:MAG: zinc-ribbon domain-containing protein [Polyangiaceae bacterium]|nr:zinc-ribbon domain-containing protein [Polyangiaceae bacterium]